MTADSHEHEDHSRRDHRLPAVRMVLRREDRRRSAVLSVLLHALIIFLLVVPIARHDELAILEQLKAPGAPGAIGGGGGGNRGTGGQVDRVTYIKVQSAPTPTVVAPTPVVEPPKPVVQPPPEPVKPPPEPEIPKLDVKVDIPPVSITVSSVVPGRGGGSGTDGSRGFGPGSGGGVGAGIGTGRGNGVGPGTGGGGGDSLSFFPPTPMELVVPPPWPSSVRGHHLVAQIDVDVTGKVIGDPKFNGTKDKNYNKVLLDMLKGLRFRPAVTYDGRPIRATALIKYDFGG